MKIIDIKVMKGPNYWSIRRHHLIVMRLDLEEMEARPTNLIPGFLERLKALFPTMQEHRCSEDFAGGFFYRVEEGTWMGHVIEHIALELQTLAGMDCGFGRTRETSTNTISPTTYSNCVRYVKMSAWARVQAALWKRLLNVKFRIYASTVLRWCSWVMV